MVIQIVPRQEPEITAFDIIESLGWEMDLYDDPMGTTWQAWFTERAYKTIKAEGDKYLYWKNGIEYVKVYDNHVIPFIIHMRVAGFDESISDGRPDLGARREIVRDDVDLNQSRLFEKGDS